VDQPARGHLAGLLDEAILDVRSLGGQHGVRHYRLTLAGDRAAFAKVHDPDAAGNVAAGFAAEASGLRWLAVPAAVPVPAVLAADERCLVTGWIGAGRPSQAAARAFGQELAAMHSDSPGRFGAPWTGEIAGLPLPNEAAGDARWPDWYAASRILPYVRIGRDAGTLSSADGALLESAASRAAVIAGPPEPPSRIHGDCWSGNVLWSGDRGWLIDPAAHGGHRETDLAMLSLFGAPYLDQILAGYQEATPLADGWRDRVPLHQLHPLLVHVCLFGGSYREPALAAARQVLAA
jgi:fructosamine-3-kinase